MPYSKADTLDEIIEKATLARLADEERERAILLLAGAARKYIRAGNDVRARVIEACIERLER